jgi:uncharacterized membrane protein
MESIIAAAKTWQLHPFVDHFTVALILIGIATDLVASLISSRIWLRYMALSLMILGAMGAWGSNVTGGWEADRVWKAVQGPGKAILERHAEIGDYLPWVFLALALWRIGVQFTAFIGASRPIYLLIALLSAGAILYQGRLGGELVYNYGIGTAVMPVSAPVAPEPAPQTAPPAQAPAAQSPAASPSPLPTVFVPPTASATPAAPPSAAMKPSPSPTAKATAGPGGAPVAGVAPEPAPTSVASPGDSAPKNL